MEEPKSVESAATTLQVLDKATWRETVLFLGCWSLGLSANRYESKQDRL